MTLIVRPLEVKDAESLARIHIETWRDTYRGVMPDSRLDALNLQDSIARWTRGLAQPNTNLQLLNVGAFQDGELIGMGAAGLPREDWGYASELWAINIPRRFQKRGAGKAILKACVQHALGFSARTMYLYCIVGNRNAEQFYSKYGAVPTERISQEDGYQERAWVWDDLEALARSLT